jgi:hypothetical protein
MTYQYLALALFFLVVAGCGIDALVSKRNKRIPISNNGAAVGDSDTTSDCGSADGGGGD